MIGKQINDPNTNVDENFISCVNGHSAALNDGDVVIFDFSSDANALIQSVVPTTTALSGKVAGVVSSPSGQSIAVGAVCKVMTRGIHKAVKKATGALTRGDAVGTSTTSLKATKNASAAPAGAQLGYAAASALSGDATAIIRVDVR